MVLQHTDLIVTSEERVLNAILLWCSRTEELHGWELVEKKIFNSSPEILFADRLQSFNSFLPLVRFPLLPHALLKKVGIFNEDFPVCFLRCLLLKSIIIFCPGMQLEWSTLSKQITALNYLVSIIRVKFDFVTCSNFKITLWFVNLYFLGWWNRLKRPLTS